MLTYGDGLSDVNLAELLAFHKKHNKIATVTAVQMDARFGGMDLAANGDVVSFREKAKDESKWINGGFFVIQPEIANYLHDDADDVMWERQPMDDLARDKQIAAYRHHDFWKCMDTLRDKEELEHLWQTEPLWKKW